MLVYEVCLSAAAVEPHFGRLNWLLPLQLHRKAVLRDGFKCQNGSGLSGYRGVGILSSLCLSMHVCIQCTSASYMCRNHLITLVAEYMSFSDFHSSLLLPSSELSPCISLLSSHSPSALCYRWQSSCLWCLAGEPGPAVSACSGHGHCSLVPGGLLALSGLPSDLQSPQFPP